jgi:ATP-dependent helicase/DNAse subunit B
MNNMRTQSIDLWIGPYRSGKTRELLKQVIDHCRKRPAEGATIVVPSDRYRRVLLKRINEMCSNAQSGEGQLPGFIGLRILTFYPYCDRLLRHLGHFNRVIPDDLRTALAAFVLNRLQGVGQLAAIDPICHYPGTPKAVLMIIDALQRSGDGPEEVLKKLQHASKKDKLQLELSQVYKRYHDCLNGASYLDRRSLAYALIKLLSKQSPGSRQLGFVAFDGFDRLNPLQLKTISAIAQHANRVLLSFDYVEPELDHNSEFTFKRPGYAQLQTILRAKLRVKRFERQESGTSIPEHTRVVDRFLAPDRYFEMVEIARQIKEKAQGRSEKLNNFLVVARSLASYRTPVQAAFKDAGIDYFMDEAIELKALPLVQFLLRILALHGQDFTRPDVIYCLRSKYFNQAKFSLSETKVDELDKLSRAKIVVSGKDQWLEALEDGAFADLRASLRRTIDRLTPPQTTGTAEQHVAWVEDVIDAVLVLDEQSNSYERWEQDSALVEFRRILATLIQEQEVLARLGEKVEGSFAAFFSRLEKLVDGANFRRQPTSKYYVLVCGAELAPNQMFEEIYIAGLAESEFPKRSYASGFTGNEQILKWLNLGIDLQDPRQDPGFETALFASLVDRACKRVVLSCPKVEMSGQELTPSMLLAEPGSVEQPEMPFVQALDRLLVRPASPRTAVAAWLWQQHSEAMPQALRQDLRMQGLLADLEEPLMVARQRTTAAAPGPFNGGLQDFITTGTIKVRMPPHWSASSLSDYGKCPFRFWVSQILQIMPCEEPKEGLSGKLLGQTYHKALELFYKKVIELKFSIKHSSDDQLLPLLNQAIVETFAWLEDQPDFRKDEFWDHGRQEVEFRLHRFFKEERARRQKDKDEFEPMMAEASFGLKSADSAPPLIVGQGESEITIVGRIDRIDRKEAASGGASILKVIDYKTGSTNISAKDVESGRHLQLPLYALAVQRTLVPKSQVVKAEYLSVQGAKPVGNIDLEKQKVDEQSLSILNQAEENVSKFVEGVRQGDFSVRPSSSAVCSYCDHKPICRIAELPRADVNENEADYAAD